MKTQINQPEAVLYNGHLAIIRNVEIDLYGTLWYHIKYDSDNGTRNVNFVHANLIKPLKGETK